MITQTSGLQKQQGAALVVSLIILLVLTVLGVASMRNTTLEEKMAGNSRDLSLAFNAAEAALRGGETDLQTAVILPPFNDTETGYRVADTTLWQTIDWYNETLVYATTIDGVAQQPRYYLEEMPAVTSGGSLEAGTAMEVGMYRVTARAVGSTDSAIAILQSTFRR